LLRNFISLLRSPFFPTTARLSFSTLSTNKGELSSVPPDLADPTLVDRASASPVDTSLPEDPPPPAAPTNATTNEEFKKVYRLDYKPPPFNVKNVDLRFELNEEDTIVKARLLFCRNQDPEASSTLKKNEEGKEIVELDGDSSVELLKLLLNGEELRREKGEFEIKEQGAKLAIVAKDMFEVFTLSNRLDLMMLEPYWTYLIDIKQHKETFVVEMTTKLKPQLNTTLYGLYKTGFDRTATLYQTSFPLTSSILPLVVILLLNARQRVSERSFLLLIGQMSCLFTRQR